MATAKEHKLLLHVELRSVAKRNDFDASNREKHGDKAGHSHVQKQQRLTCESSAVRILGDK